MSHNLFIFSPLDYISVHPVEYCLLGPRDCKSVKKPFFGITISALTTTPTGLACRLLTGHTRSLFKTLTQKEAGNMIFFLRNEKPFMHHGYNQYGSHKAPVSQQ